MSDLDKNFSIENLESDSPRSAAPAAAAPAPKVAWVEDDVGFFQFLSGDSTLPEGSTTDDTTPTLFGENATPGSLIRIYRDGNFDGTAVVRADGTWIHTLSSPLTQGDHQLVAVVIQPGGGESDRLSLIHI